MMVRALQRSPNVKAMLSEFILPVIAYLITLLVLWATVAITKLVATRVSMPVSIRGASRPVMIGTRTR
jgi:hypothetical protein